ncbi:MAG: histidine kinase [Bdellovibrionales bacterium RIFCSPHIGHO2_01_FULL_40_29]|nr:MAG: histidine kinase [Bdellovibrionales bacterium RIFCSPHIGHO2_01_FULL_40_29]OFZ34024.1 MAG: histidine kinase [Bdellovibrionales bacterium RIFCSPHIGHO2_02_FULL_40_15]
MNSNDIRQLKPFLSLLIVIGTLMGLVFIKMEERRLSYVVLKLTREFKRSNEISRQKEISLAKLTRPQLVANVATQKLTLRKIKPGQIINLTTMPIVAENNLSFKSRVHP